MDRYSNILEHPASDIDLRLGSRIRSLRAASGLSLDEAARLSGVSRSMISLIERGESSPTARVLDRLASALGTSLATLFQASAPPSGEPVARRGDQVTWRDPETGYLRRNLSPAGHPSAVELVEIVLPAGARVAYDGRPGPSALDQQVWVLNGEVEITVGDDACRLSAGDCLAMRPDRPTTFRNSGAGEAAYLVAIAALKR